VVRRLTLFAVSLTIAVCACTPSAFAWSNGPSADGQAGYGYGTHDWILEHAIELAGEQGAWVDVEEALWHTADPDYYKTNSDLHLFRDFGKSRGGPQAVADLYYEAAQAIKGDDSYTASAKLGVLSHYYADMLVPFHTTYDAIDHPALHIDYEREVDMSHRGFEDPAGWISEAQPQPVADVRARAVAAAQFSFGRYDSLLDVYSRYHTVRGDSTVDALTGELLSRAVNDLADIVRTLPTGEGASAPPAKITATVSNKRPAAGHKVCTYAKCFDADGRTLKGVRVEFYWPRADGGLQRVSAYTDSTGVAHSWYTISGSLASGTKLTVKTVARSSGATTSSGKTLVVR